ncbi:fungal-specific transcription factor domain-containing protein [Mycena polygramma]|nr:fungal-specific transcription factor domain-containing protein [Mycena polygramma]
MSSNEEDYAEEFHRGKKRRVQRACDVCRRRKSRCDGSQVPGDKCTICIEARLECTYIGAAPKRAGPEAYIASLEKRLAESEALVRRLRAELAAVRASSSFLNDGSRSDIVGAVRPAQCTAVFLFFMRKALHNLAAPQPPPYGDDLVHLDLARRLQNLQMGPLSERRFIGKSSGVMLLNVAMDLKEHAKREEQNAHGHTNDLTEDESETARLSWSTRRLHFWTWKPWESTVRPAPTYRLPSQARLAELVDLYFTHQNVYLPLLHRPTFERNIAEGLHLSNDEFAATVLVVCAIASRWDMDPDTEDLARGWEWFDQIALVESHLFGKASLYILQYYSLAAQFLDGSSSPPTCWNLVGLGLRAAQDVGCHRRNGLFEVPSVESELYKRAFWVLVYQDRVMSANMGCACAVQYEDFDVDLPTECDDEYWEHPTHPFQQPTGVPSRVTFFNTLIRLHHILAFSLKILYGLSKGRLIFMQDVGWEDKAVAELDSALNNWHDQIPDHLRWDPARADPVFFDQSVSLYCAYYHLQILIHRPFIPVSDTHREMVNVHKCMEVMRSYENRWQSAGSLWDILAELASVGQLPLPDASLNSDSNHHSGTAVTQHTPRNSQSTFASRQAFDCTIDDLQFRALYEPTPQPSPFSAAIPGNSGSLAPDPSAFAQTSGPEPWLASEDPYAQIDPAQASRELGDMMNLIDNYNDTIAMWTNAPIGLELDAWGNYFSSFSELTQGQTAHADMGMNGHPEQP